MTLSNSDPSDALRVLFIAGPSRGGSTLLGRLLGTVPGFVHVGELTYLWDRGPLQNQLCGCGQPFRECPFWTAVLTDAFGSPVLSPQRANELLRLRNHSDHLPRSVLLAVPGTGSRKVSLYRQVLQQLMSSIRRVSGAEVVVDSSKRPSHGILLRRIPGMDLTCLHLVRDSRAVSHSTRRTRRRPEIVSATAFMPTAKPWKQALRWNVYNALSELVRVGSSRSARVRYEDFAERPVDELNQLLRELAFPTIPSAIARPPRDGASVLALPTEHTVSGNPMRFDVGDITVKLDDEWRTAMPARNRKVVSTLSAPLLHRYGYI